MIGNNYGSGKKSVKPGRKQQTKKRIKKTTKVAEDLKLNEEEKERYQERKVNDKSSLEKNITGSEEIMEDEDESKVTNIEEDVVNKKGQ